MIQKQHCEPRQNVAFTVIIVDGITALSVIKVEKNAQRR